MRNFTFTTISLQILGDKLLLIDKKKNDANGYPNWKLVTTCRLRFAVKMLYMDIQYSSFVESKLLKFSS